MTGDQDSRASAASFRRAVLALAALLLPLGLTACDSASEKANKAEARYDAYMRINQPGPAMREIRKALSNQENEPRLWIKLAQAQLMTGNAAGAADSYQHALDLKPDSVEALENLAILSVRGGQFDTAKRFIEPLLLLQPNDLSGLLASAAIALRERRWDEAARVADLLIEADPELAEGHIMKARVLEGRGRPRDAANLLEQRLKLTPDNKDYALQLLGIYQGMSDKEGVRSTAIRLTEMFPDDPRYAMEAARAFQARGDEPRARQMIARLVQRFGGNTSLMLAVAQFWSDTLPPAAARFEIAAMATRSSLRVRTALAERLIDMGDPARAIALLAPSAAGKLTVANVDAKASYARALYAVGRMAEVKQITDDILGFDETHPAALLLRARLALARGNTMAAATDAQIVASDDETNEEAALLVAKINDAGGNQLLAAKSYGDARQRFPDSLRTLRAEADWLIARKQPDEATKRVGAFVRANTRRADAWAVYRDVCAAAKDSTCLAEARRGLAGFAK